MAQSEVSSIARHSAIYLLGGLLNRSASFILLPLYLNVLTPTEYGWLSVVLVSMEVLALLLGLGLGSAMVRLLVDCETEEQTGEVIGSALAFFLLPSLVLLALVWPASQAVAALVKTAGIPPMLFALGFGAAIFTVLFEICVSVFRGLKMSWMYTALSTGKSVLFLGFNTLFLIGFQWGVTGVLLGTIISVALLVIYTLYWFWSRYSLSVSKPVMRRLAKIGLPIVPGAVLDAVFSAMDKFYLAAFVDPATVGVYALAAKLAHLVRIGIAAPFAQIWAVRRLEVETAPGDAQNNPIFASTFFGFLMLLLAASLALSLFAPEVIWLIGKPGFYGAAEFVPFALAGIYLYILKWNFEIGIFAAEKTIWVSVVSGAVLLLAVPLYSLLLPAYGAYGAAVALVILGVIRSTLTAILSSRFSSVVRTFPFWRAMAGLALTVACYVIPRYLTGAFTPFEDLGIRALSLLAFTCITALGVLIFGDVRGWLKFKSRQGATS